MLQLVTFYISGFLYFFGFISLILFRHQKYFFHFFIPVFLLPLALIYLSIILRTLYRHPYLLLDNSYSGVMHQYQDSWIIISSVTHFGFTDLITSSLIFYLTDNLGFDFWHCLPYLPILFLWNPIGAFLLSLSYLLRLI